MRILYLDVCGQMGGAETSLTEVLASVRAAEPSWELSLVLGEDGPLARMARERGVRVIVEPVPKSLAQVGDSNGRAITNAWSLLKALGAAAIYTRRLNRIMDHLQPEVIHTNGFKMHLLGSWARSNATVIWHMHDYVSSRRLMRWLLKGAAHRCSGMIANSQSVAEDVRKVLPGLTVLPIYNAVDIDRFTPGGPKIDLDAMAGLPPAADGTVRVGFVGTFARWKGHKVFLQALAQLPENLPVRGYIIGGPIYRTSGSQWSMSELNQEARRLGLADKIGFTGFVEDCAAAMRSLDVIVHASTQPEPFGMVIIEGMACEKAVIASREGGAVELFVDGESGLTHTPGDAAQLAARIERLVRDKELRARLGKAGRDIVEQRYHNKRLGDELTACYRQFSGQANRPPAERCYTIAANSGNTAC